jgi:putative FmdB family regulatory protein
MPIYEYECSECGGIEEAFQKMSDAPLKECSKCKGKLKKLVSHSSFHLKGSGWYVTDYGNSKNGSKKSPSKSPAKTENKVSKKASQKEAVSK